MGRLPDRPYNTTAMPTEHRHTVVVVDEHEDTSFVLVEALKIHGFDAEGFAEPGPALERLKSLSAPCTLIVDYKIGQEEGAAFIRAARASNPKVPIAVCTVASPDHAALRKLGVVEVIETPRSMEQIIDMILQHDGGPRDA